LNVFSASGTDQRQRARVLQKLVRSTRYVPILPSAYSQQFLYDAFVVPQRQWDHRSLFCTFMHWKQDILPRPATRVIRARTARPIDFQQESSAPIHNPCATAHLEPKHELLKKFSNPLAARSRPTQLIDMTAFMTGGFGSEWKGLFNMVSFPRKVSTSDIDFGLREERAIAPT
jgi:hypothetical protein